LLRVVHMLKYHMYRERARHAVTRANTPPLLTITLQGNRRRCYQRRRPRWKWVKVKKVRKECFLFLIGLV